MERIPIADMIHGGVYRTQSRNLIIGVWNENTKGIVGIREKFGDRYLFTEFHYENGAPHGTASPLRLMGHLPDDMPFNEHFTKCKQHNRPAKYQWSIPFSPYRGQWVHEDDGSVMDEDDRAQGHLNRELFDFLLPYEEIVLEERRLEDEARDLEIASLKYKPMTLEEHEKAVRREAARTWLNSEYEKGRRFHELMDEFHDRLKGIIE